MNKTFFIIIMLLFFSHLFYGQKKTSEQIYNIKTDTLITICNMIIDLEKITLKRAILLQCDSLSTNIKGVYVKSFCISAITLGKSNELCSGSSAITPQMKSLIKGESQKYKFIYIKNIVLFNTFGDILKPSCNALKLSFID